ncbi:hypothetical protein [Haloferula sp. BvORR071]|uniref:nSTAND1 domain-containing NTPase n=1 Tax=Haloferula sp. BvORR071 TaxID=1396141 RepID=UPI00054E7387|nr:hypothetical protein [Haloferula sp. BvORR071]
MQVLTLFVSSPGDVRDERQAVGRIVERLQARYWNFIRLEPVLWEKEPLRATAHFNEELIRPSDCDLFVCILWSRLGSPLPSQFNRKDGTRFDSGTEWELEEATDAFEERAKKDPAKAKPDILVYRRTSEPPAGDPSQENPRREQRKKLDAFCERFFFNKDKTIRRAFSPYESVDEFTTLFEQHLEKLLLRHIQLQRGLAQDAVRPLPLVGSPFKGLGAFDFEDAPLFFGRNRPIAEALAKLKENQVAGHAFLLIYGGSGYGKSSLMKAGLAPRLMAEGYLPTVGAWCGTGFRPVEGDSPPMETLARALVDALPDLAKLRDTSAPVPQAPPPSQPKGGKRGKKHQQQHSRKPAAQSAAPVWDSARLARMMGKTEDLSLAIAAIIAALDRMSAGKPAQLLILVDQLEEIFTARGITDEMRDEWFHVLAALAMSRRVWVVATMRSEFFPRVPEQRDLFQLVRHGGGYILSPPELPELHQIIRYPALSAGLQFERHPETGRDLSEQIYQDAADAHDALPLLEFTLEELYQRRRENLLTWAAYEELGGLAGAIASRAQETYDALPSETRREAASHIFGELVTLDASNEGPATRRRARKEILQAAHPGAPGFIDAFVDSKLLVTGEENGSAVVGLAHEALITHWPVLKQWIEDHRDLLLARRRLEDATRQWTTGGKSAKFLLTEGRLSEAERVSSSGVFHLSADETELVALSKKRAQRKLRLFQGATVVFAGLAIGAGVLGLIAQQKKQEADTAKGKAELSDAETRRSLAKANFDAGAARVESGAPDEALPYLIAALESDRQQLDAQALLLTTLRRTAWHFPVARLHHPLPVMQIAFGPDDKTLFASIDGGTTTESFNTTLRWDLAGPSIPSLLLPSTTESTEELSVAPGGRRLIVQRGYRGPDSNFLCDAETMEPLHTIPMYVGVPGGCFAWSAEGALLAYPTSFEGGLAWVIADANTGDIIRQSERLDLDEPRSVQIDRERLRAIHGDGTLIELPLSPALPMRRARPATNTRFSQAIFSPDGKLLLAQEPTSLNGAELTFYYIKDDEATKELQFGPADTPEHRRWLDSAPLKSQAGWNTTTATLWSKLLAAKRAGENLPLKGADITLPVPLMVEGSTVHLADVIGSRTFPVAPFRLDAQATAASFSGNRVATGTTSGELEIDEMLPRMDHALAAKEAPAEEEQEGWGLKKLLQSGYSLENRGNVMRLVHEGEAPVILEKPKAWTSAMDVALSPDGMRAVQAGYGFSTGGNRSPGVVLSDAKSGRILSGLEAVEGAMRVEFLQDGHRIAVIGGPEVAIFEVGATTLKKLATIPVVNAVDFFPLSHAKLLAIATATQVTLHSTTDFSQVAALPLEQPAEVGDRPTLENPWAEDERNGWLAFAPKGSLTVWSTSAARTLLSNLPLAAGPQRMSFADQAGFRGLKLEGVNTGFIPLAKSGGLTADELNALRSFSQGLAGTKFDADSSSIVRLSREQRREALGKDQQSLPALFPAADPASIRDLALALGLVESSPQAWQPLWDRLAASGKLEDPFRLAQWSADLGQTPWRRQFLLGRIAASDQQLFDFWHGEVPPKKDDGSSWMPDGGEIAALHEFAGDDESVRKLKEASWLAARTLPKRLGKMLADPDFLENLPEVNATKLQALEPDSIAQMRAELVSNSPENERLEWLDEYARREAALALLDAQVAATLKEQEAAPSAEHALDHARALALRGETQAAGEFLAGKVPGDSVLTLEQAHFLLSAGLEVPVREALERALPELKSPWLWQQWLRVRSSGDAELTPLVQRAMDAVGGTGPAAVEALKISLERKDATAIAACLQAAKSLPDALKAYVAGSALWAEGKKAGAFALWPGGFPEDFANEPELRDWHGWELALPAAGEEDLFKTMGEELAKLQLGPEATVEDYRALATRLLDPETATTFGAKRIRDAMVACATNLADDRQSGELVNKMIEHARLAGAPHVECLRIEARVFMAAGEFTAAYSRWLQVIESEEGEILASDYTDAARCVIEDMQVAAAVELLNRGKKRFPADPDFALDAAWLLLSNAQPEDSGVFLEHGFAIPFAPELQQTALAMLVCAAEETERKERADQALADLLALSPDWGTDEYLKSLDWPEALKQSLLAVAKRNRPEPEPEPEPAPPPKRKAKK